MAASPRELSTSINQKPRQLRITVTPIFDEPTQHVEAIDVTLILPSPGKLPGASLLKMPFNIFGMPLPHYDGSAIQASDAGGILPLDILDTKQGERHWLVYRATNGSTMVTFRAWPRPVNSSTTPGPYINLRKDSGSLIGIALGFIPEPLLQGVFDIRVAFDIASTLPGTRAVWTYGEYDAVYSPVLKRTGTMETLMDSIFAVGKLQSYPPAFTEPDSFATYWSGEDAHRLNLTEVSLYAQQLFNNMSSFFSDTDQSYRIFFIKNPYHSTGGSALKRSYILGYAEKGSLPDREFLDDLLAHELVHNWPLMQPTPGSGIELDAWFNEGIATYYSFELPRRFGAISLGRAQDALNNYAQAYYTSPLVALSNEEAARRTWKTPSAQTLPYHRGVVYLVKLDYQLRCHSGGERSLDNMIFEFLRRKNDPRLDYQVKDWVELLRMELGEEGVREFYAMMAGELIIPSRVAYGPNLVAVKKNQEKFELGFSEKSLYGNRGGGLIWDLKIDSRAAQAGVRNGDRILSHSSLDNLTEQFGMRMELVLQRPDENGAGSERSTFKLAYWPRSFERVESYQWEQVTREASTEAKQLPLSRMERMLQLDQSKQFYVAVG